jgi:uncharacterized iron-regulated membrane protein
MKVFFRRIHLYLSLAAGAVILIACLTGAILVFEKDLQMALNKERYYVAPQGTHLTVERLLNNVSQKFPGNQTTGVKLYSDANRSVEVNLVAAAKKEEKSTGQPAMKAASANTPPAAPRRQPGFTVFVNPYSGEVIEKYSYRETFFYKIFALHRWLLGGEGSIGKYIVGISTFIFLFILITGIILWWPKSNKILMQRLKIKSNASWKRLNHDLHIVLGFYSAIFLFIFAFTGLAWSFEWFNKGIYKVTNSSMKPPPTPKSVYEADATSIGPDLALAAVMTKYKAAEYYNVLLPKDSADPMTVNVLPLNALHESATDAVYVDQYSGDVLSTLPFSERSLGARVRSSFKPVHTGSIWGTPSRIIAFIVCLFGASFPVTGVIMWLNRIRKKNRQRSVPVLTEEDHNYVDP